VKAKTSGFQVNPEYGLCGLLLLHGMCPQPLPAFEGQAIALGWAARCVRLRPFDPAALQGRIEVVLTKCRAMGEIQRLHQLLAANCLISERFEQQSHLVGYLIAYLVGSMLVRSEFERPTSNVEHRILNEEKEE
jgi:hypothetical protein